MKAVKKKATALLLLLICVLLVACGGGAPAQPQETTGAAEEVTTTQAAVGQTKLIMATNAEFEPFEFITGKDKGVVGEYDGIDILIAQAVAEDLGMELEISNMEFDSIIPALVSGKADFGLAGMTITEERLANVDFSVPYWVAVQSILVNSSNEEIVNVESLQGKKVGVVTGFTGDLTLTDLGIEPERYRKGIDAVVELSNGKLDAVVIDTPTGRQLIKNFADLKAVQDDAAFEKEEYAIAVKKGNTELLEKINASLQKLMESGAIEQFAVEVDGRLGAE